MTALQLLSAEACSSIWTFPQAQLADGVVVPESIGSFSFIGFGTIAAVLPMLYTERGAQMAYIVRALLLLALRRLLLGLCSLAGCRLFSYISPATYVLDGLRQGIQQGRGVGDLGYDLWPLLLCTVLSIPIGLTIFNAAGRPTPSAPVSSSATASSITFQAL